MKPLRDEYPVMDALVGYATWDAILFADDLVQKYRGGLDDGPFLGRVTAITSNFEHSIGLVLRRRDSFVVMATGNGVMFWNNVGCHTILTPEEFQSYRFRPDVDLRKLAASIIADAVVPCSCPVDESECFDDGEWNGRFPGGVPCM